MGVYTKKGDRGDTSTLDKSKGRIDKDSLIVEALGSLDELNSYMGVVRSCCDRSERQVFLREIQENIFMICSMIAGADLKFNMTKITRLEKEIDWLEAKLQPIDSFRISQGTSFATHLMYARSLARKAERMVVALSKEEKISPQVLQYLNRLSDMMFMLFREANFEAQVLEESWKMKPATSGKK